MSLPPLRPIQDIRWYLYRSAPKIEMLYHQMFDTKSATTEVSGTIFGVGASISRTRGDEVLEDKPRRIESELTERRMVGSLEEPNEYILGTMRMRWGLFDDHGMREEGTPPLVYFGGIDKPSATIVGLGGSSVNVRGNSGASGTHSRSYTGEILEWLLAGDQTNERPMNSPWWDEPADEEWKALQAVAIALHGLKPPTNELSFLARVLVKGKITNLKHMTGLPAATVILGTPIYVAETHPHPDENSWGLDAEWDQDPRQGGDQQA